MAFTPDRLLHFVTVQPEVEHYLVGFSGGLDSTVLLHALTQARVSATFSIEAVHVHHGLQPQADAWANHCRGVCERWVVPFRLIHIDAKPARGESPEAAARNARYNAFREVITRGACLLTAHHQDDQAETLLLQLLRGAGPAGLAAMPEIVPFNEGWHARPLLAFTRVELADYARRGALTWIIDPSNADTTQDRNFLRHNVMTQLRARRPQAARALSRAACLQAEALSLLRELAHEDLATARGRRPGTLSVASLARLSPARQRNAVRHWLADHELPIPAQRQLEQILRDALVARWDATLKIAWSGGEVRRYRDDLYAMPPLPQHNPSLVLHWNARASLNIPHLDITLEPDILALTTTVDRKDVTVRFRRGGERCKPVGHRHHRDLKKLFQEAGVPPWERDRIPLIYVAERLVAVIGFWGCEWD
jgi:tRNA(Ile)-lysidine synthase